ncbi:MAG: hypothetical protein ACOCP1_03380 [Campylobacterales bacterium]
MILLDANYMDDKLNIVNALKLFESENIDFVDAVLCAKSDIYQIKTFDKKLLKCIGDA